MGRHSSAEQLRNPPVAHDLGFLASFQRLACQERSAEETARIIKHLCSRRLLRTLQLVLENTSVRVGDENCLLKV